MSLRARLVAIVVVLTAAGLTVAGVVTFAALRSFLFDRVDRELSRAVPAVADEFRAGFGLGPKLATGLPAGTYAELRSPDGVVVRNFVVRIVGTTPPLPDLPDTIVFPAGRDVAWLTVGEREDAPAFRVRAERDPDSAFTLLIAAPLDDVQSTLRRLVVIELIVSSAVLVVLSGSAWWAVRVGLRPLRRIEATTAAIAEGDLSRRVDVTDRSEVGRLGASFNTMLGRIEAAFTEKEAALAAKEQSEQRLRRFVADASHELRTPLTAIRAHAELFRRGAAHRPEDLALVMRRIEEEAARMGVLVEDLLLLARLDQGRPLERRLVDLSVLAADAAADARAVEPERPVTLEVPGPVLVLGDDARLRQVLGNLLGNVREHTPAGTPVTVRVGATDGTAVIEVADGGPGIAPDDLDKVFERFYRADGSRTRATGGAGLGLSIVAAIARAHGGEATVRSAPGEGATFVVTLPLAGPLPPPEPQAVPSALTGPAQVGALD